MVRKNIKITSLFTKAHIPHWLTLLIAVQLILRIPSLFEPFSYGDEMIYLSLGEAIRRGLVLYKDIHDNKPPLLYFLAAIAGNVFWFRAILAAWMSATIIIFWKLVSTIFPKNQNIQKVATIAFTILTTIPLLEGNIANAELFMAGPTIAAFYILLSKKHNLTNLLLSGALFSISTLFKVPAIFDIPTIFFYWLITAQKRNDNFGAILKRTFWIGVGFIIPIGLFFLWYLARGAFSEYFSVAYLNNVGYLSSWRPSDAQKSFLVRNGPLFSRAAVVLLGMGIIAKFKKYLSKGFILATLWLLFSLFGVTLSERPYPHYLIQSVPAISMLIGILVASIRYEQVLTIIPLLLATFVPVYFRFYYYPTVSYYTRFVKFATGSISNSEYFAKFDGNVNLNYQIAKYLTISSSADQPVFVWGDAAPIIYALSRRLPPLKYVATYHINDFSTHEQVVTQLVKNKPEYIIILPQSPEFGELRQLVTLSYSQVTYIQQAEIWKLTK